MSTNPIEVIYRTFGGSIEVCEGSEGPLYNGYPSPHAALLENNFYRDLDFAQQMVVCAAVRSYIAPLSEEAISNEAMTTTVTYVQDGDPRLDEGRTFIYTYDWHATANDYACTVLSQETGDLIFDEWLSVLQERGIMENVDDVEGLAIYLVRHGEILHGDTLAFETRHDEDEDDELEA
jgi:hypothetical protein